MNILLYVGLFLIVGGFCLFLYSQMRLRQLDRELFKNEQLNFEYQNLIAKKIGYKKTKALLHVEKFMKDYFCAHLNQCSRNEISLTC